ncbi:MAG: GH92 family glycosyl hydrolase [Candidatus Thermoplasmatota archaeon]|nr:GH92 family glycosyl hydrolase [Candidatus Thermoplasmatota archaeon]
MAKRTLAIALVGLVVAAGFSGCIGDLGGIFGGGNDGDVQPADYVNPLVGSLIYGNTFPGPTMPFGMVQLSPDTETGDFFENLTRCSGYYYTTDSIIGFSHTHLSGTGCSDYGDILLMPTKGEVQTEPGSASDPDSGYRSRFSHENEVAKAGYYSVLLDDSGIKAELTATTRAGIHRYTFPQGSDSHILIDLEHGMKYMGFGASSDCQINIVDENTVEGSRGSIGWARHHTVYFAAEFSKSFSSSSTFNMGQQFPGVPVQAGTGVGAVLNFDTQENEQIVVKVGISFVSIEGARANLETEAKGWDFDEYRQNAEDAWNEQLKNIEISGGSEDERTTFYTALYHTMIEPNIFSDVDGSYLGVDYTVHQADPAHPQYTLFSTWDTFRALHPLLTIIDPERDADIIQSMINIYNDGGGLPTGWLPRWFIANADNNCMTGTHADSIIADAYTKGITGFDAETAYEAMWKNANIPGAAVVPEFPLTTLTTEGRYGLQFYSTIGYVPGDTVPFEALGMDVNPTTAQGVFFWLLDQGTTRTLEYAYDDFCVAQMAKAMGNTADYETLMGRSKSYANLFDSETGFMRGKSITGQWMNENDFDPFKEYMYYVEGNAWQWTFFVPHDVYGLADLFGGKEKFIEKLDSLFAQEEKIDVIAVDASLLIGQYVHPNEPCHHILYMYDYVGQPWKTQERVRQVMDEFYGPGPDGLCGNDDCGQTSAWYVLSAMGFYQVAPGDPIYCIGSPIFDKVVIHLSNGKDFTIEAKKNSPENKYVQSAKLNGVEYDKTWFSHSDIVSGRMLLLEMGSSPSAWGTAPKSAPISLYS